MTTQQLRDLLNVNEQTPDPDRRADLEIAREYFTNPDFRARLSSFVWEVNQKAATLSYTASLCHVLDHVRATPGQWQLTESGCIRHIDGISCPIVKACQGVGEDADGAGKFAGLDPEAINALIGSADNLDDCDPHLRAELLRAAGVVEVRTQPAGR